MIYLVAGVFCWIACTILSYLLMRSHVRSTSPPWTTSDRRFYGIGSIIAGPFALFASITTSRSSFNDSQTEAKW